MSTANQGRYFISFLRNSSTDRARCQRAVHGRPTLRVHARTDRLRPAWHPTLPRLARRSAGCRDRRCHRYRHSILFLFSPTFLNFHLSIHLSIHPSIQLSIHPSINPIIHPSIYLSNYPSIHLSIHLSIFFICKE